MAYHLIHMCSDLWFVQTHFFVIYIQIVQDIMFEAANSMLLMLSEKCKIKNKFVFYDLMMYQLSMDNVRFFCGNNVYLSD